MVRKLKTFGQRFAIMLSGEALQSAFGFVLNISLVRSLPAAQYGSFAIVIVIGGFGLMYMRALIGVPACTHFPQSRRPAEVAFYSVMFGSAAMTAALIWAGAVAVLLAVWLPAGALAGACFAGASALRFYVRMALFAQGRATLGTASDIAYTLAAAVFCFAAIGMGTGEGLLDLILYALTAAHFCGAGLSFLVLRLPLRFSLNRAIRARLLKLLPAMGWSLISVSAANIQGQGGILLLAIYAGPAAYAPVAACMTFFSPLRLAAAALANMTQPEFAKTIVHRGYRAVLETLLMSTGMIAAVCGLYGALMFVLFPLLSAHVLAHRFDGEPLGRIATLVWAIATVAVLYSVPRTLLETVQKYRENTVLAIIGAAAGLPLVGLLLIWTTPAWSLTGVLVSESVVLAGSWLAAMPVIFHVPGGERMRQGAGWLPRVFANPGSMPVRLAAAREPAARRP